MGTNPHGPELLRLLKERQQLRQNELFGGLSSGERAEYNRKQERINQLIELSGANAQQGMQWEKEPETDTARTEGRQSYRSRENSPNSGGSDSYQRSGCTEHLSPNSPIRDKKGSERGSA